MHLRVVKQTSKREKNDGLGILSFALNHLCYFREYLYYHTHKNHKYPQHCFVTNWDDQHLSQFGPVSHLPHLLCGHSKEEKQKGEGATTIPHISLDLNTSRS